MVALREKQAFNPSEIFGSSQRDNTTEEALTAETDAIAEASDAEVLEDGARRGNDEGAGGTAPGV